MTDVLSTEVLADDAPFNGLVGQRLLRKEDPKLVPAASDVPAVFTDHTVTPSPSTPMGHPTGCGQQSRLSGPEPTFQENP